MAVKRVGVRELRKDLAEHLQGDDAIVIERHGQILGVYAPVDREKVAAALQDFHAAVEAILRDTGMTRDELADALVVERGAHESHR